MKNEERKKRRTKQKRKKKIEIKMISTRRENDVREGREGDTYTTYINVKLKQDKQVGRTGHERQVRSFFVLFFLLRFACSSSDFSLSLSPSPQMKEASVESVSQMCVTFKDIRARSQFLFSFFLRNFFSSINWIFLFSCFTYTVGYCRIHNHLYAFLSIGFSH